ncbi:MAG TPA: MFS transporter [Alphaproteobacteria bacterium]|nr:MFS transporter [Alphaproteobacteria bacterium]
MSESVSKTRWSVVAAAIGAGIVAAMHIGTVPAAIPALRAELGLDLITAGWVVSMFSATTVASGIVVGVVADRIGYRRLLLGGLVALVAGALAGAAAHSEAALLLFRLIEGIGFITTLVSAPSIIAETAAPSDRRFALGIWGTYMPTGLALGMAIAPAMLAAWGWRAVWIGAAVITALCLVAVAAMLPKRPAAHSGGSWVADIRLTLAEPGVWLLAAFFMFYAAQWMALMVWLPTFLIEERGLSLVTAAWMTIVVVAVNALGNLFGASLLARNVPRWVLLAGSSCVVLVCAVGIFRSGLLSDELRYALCLLYSLITGVCPAAILSGAAVFRPSPRQTGATNGFLIQGSNLGQFVGPPAMAALVSLGGAWSAGLGVFLVGGSAGILLAFLVKWAERRRGITPS